MGGGHQPSTVTYPCCGQLSQAQCFPCCRSRPENLVSRSRLDCPCPSSACSLPTPRTQAESGASWRAYVLPPAFRNIASVHLNKLFGHSIAHQWAFNAESLPARGQESSTRGINSSRVKGIVAYEESANPVDQFLCALLVVYAFFLVLLLGCITGHHINHYQVYYTPYYCREWINRAWLPVLLLRSADQG